MTEEEAEKRWCPFVRASGSLNGQAVTINRAGNDITNATCISSECMAWRETKVAIKKGELTSRVVEERIDGFTAEYGPAQEDIPEPVPVSPSIK